MKKLLFILFMSMACIAQAQTKPEPTKQAQDTTIKGVTYQIQVGSRGGKYIVVTSKKGTIYKRYLQPRKQEN